MIARSFSKSFSFGNRPGMAFLSSDSTVIIVGGPGEILYSASPVSSFSQATGGYIDGSAGNLYSAGYGAGKYIIGGSYGEIFTATTLPDFTKSVIPVMFTNNQNIEGMVYGNGIWVAVGSDPSRIATSLDGVTWTTRTSAVSSSGFGALIFANGCFLCTAGYGKMMRSIDGINWSLVTTGFSTDSFFNTIPALVWTGEYFVAASSDDGYAVRSVDGITWTTMNIGTGSAGFYYHAAHGDGKVTILLGNNGYYRYSSDLVTWTLAQIPGLSGGTNTICYDGQKYIVTSGGGGTIRQSIDGILWTTPSMGIDPTATYYRSYNFNTTKDPFYANVESIVDFNSITEFYPIISQSSQGNFTSPITINSADDFCMEAFIDRSQGSSSVFSMHDNAYQTLSFFDMRGGSRILGVEMHSQFDNIVLNTTKDMVHIALFKSAGVCYLTIDGVVRNSVPYTGGNRVISSGFFSTNGTDGIRKFRVCVGYTPYTGAFTPTDYLDDLPAASGIVSYLDCEDYNLDGTYLAPQEQSISRVWSGSQSMGFFSDHAGNKFKAPSNLAYHPTIKQGVVISNSSLSGKVLRIDNPTNVINILTHNMKSYDRPPFVHASRIATLEAMIEFDNPDITGTQDLSQGSDFSVAFMKFMTNNNFSRGLIIVHADHNAAADVTIKIQAGSNFYTVPQTIPYNTKTHVALQYDMGSVFFCINGTRHLIATYNPSVTDYVKIEYKHFILNGGKSNYLRMTNGVARYGATYTVPSTPYPLA